MLHEFLAEHREEIISRTAARIALRMAPRPTAEELARGVPLFLDQLIALLQCSLEPGEAMAANAVLHGAVLLRRGFTLSQVVHDYGDICQTVTHLADELNAPVTAEEFRVLNDCLDQATAHAVTEYARLRDRSISEAETERLGVMAHELRNLLATAMMAYDILRTGRLGVNSNTGAVLGRSLRGLRDVIDRTLSQVRLEGGALKRERIVMAEFIEEVEVSATLEAHARGVQLTVTPVEYGVAVEADRHTLASAVENLLQNAFKFTRPGGHVSLTTHASADRVVLDIADECGGLPPGKAEELFQPFAQRGGDRSGLGLGLSISLQGVRANGGEIRVRDVPGTGCVFTVDLPRMVAPAQGLDQDPGGA